MDDDIDVWIESVLTSMLISRIEDLNFAKEIDVRDFNAIVGLTKSNKQNSKKLIATKMDLLEKEIQFYLKLNKII